MKLLLDSPPARVELTLPGTPIYNEAITLAKLIYRNTYNATIDPHPHGFLVCADASTGEIEACAGVTFASRERLFSESYLDCTMDQTLFDVFGHYVEPDKVVEITTLATKTPTLGSELVRILPIWLWFMGLKAVVCTITEKLQVMFTRHRLPFSVVAMADRARVTPRDGVDWGTYYEAGPRTVIVRLDQIGHLFQRNCGRYNLGSSERRMGAPLIVSP